MERKKNRGKNHKSSKNRRTGSGQGDAIKTDNLIRLNKYLANAGVCSRREADKLIASGIVKVNGKIVAELGTKISPDDKVQCGGETLKKE